MIIILIETINLSNMIPFPRLGLIRIPKNGFVIPLMIKKTTETLLISTSLPQKGRL